MTTVRLVIHLNHPATPVTKTLTVPVKSYRLDDIQSSATIVEYLHFSTTDEPMVCMSCNCVIRPDAHFAERIDTAYTVFSRFPDGSVEVRHEIFAACANLACMARGYIAASDTSRDNWKRKRPTGDDILDLFRTTACAGCDRLSAPRENGFKQCAGCHCFRYCSPECQTAHWTKHKIICRAIAEAKAAKAAKPVKGAGRGSSKTRCTE